MLSPASAPRTPPAIAPPFVVDPVSVLRALADTVAAAPIPTEVGVTERKELARDAAGVVCTAMAVCADVCGQGQSAAENVACSGHTKDTVVETLLLVEVLEVEAELEVEVAVDEAEVVFVDVAGVVVKVVLTSAEDEVVVGAGVSLLLDVV